MIRFPGVSSTGSALTPLLQCARVPHPSRWPASDPAAVPYGQRGSTKLRSDDGTLQRGSTSAAACPGCRCGLPAPKLCRANRGDPDREGGLCAARRLAVNAGAGEFGSVRRHAGESAQWQLVAIS